MSVAVKRVAVGGQQGNWGCDAMTAKRLTGFLVPVTAMALLALLAIEPRKNSRKRPIRPALTIEASGETTVATAEVVAEFAR